MSKAAAALVAAVVAGSVAWAQDAPVAPAIDVFVIKRNISGSRSMSAGSQPGGLDVVTNGTIQTIFGNAYPSQSNDVVGAPDWFFNERYDITTRISGNPTREQRQQLWRTLLADRLKLKAHYETREQPTYALVLARSDGRLGPNLRKSVVDCAALRASMKPGDAFPVLPAAANGMQPCTTRSSNGLRMSGGQTMERLAQLISGAVSGRLVFDRTGLQGDYEFLLEYSAAQPGEPAPGDKPDIFTALEEQLGLKLEPTRSQIEFVVIDHIERPVAD